jgi:hypothetical protein
MVFLSMGPRALSLAASCTLFATIGSGCVSPGSDQFTRPVASRAVTSDPVVLNGAGGKISTPAAKTVAKTEPAPSAAAAATDAGATDAAQSPAGASLFAAKPLPPLPETPAVAAAPPDPAADAPITKNAEGYPNINAPVREPASKLLPDDERARVISELEALRKKGGAGKDSGGVEVAKKGAAKAKIPKCPDGATAAGDSNCKSSQ